jgi:Tol biopolymer transport system component
VYLRDSTLQAQPFDAAAGRITGAPRPMIENVSAFSVSPNGVLAYSTSEVAASRGFVWMTLDGKSQQLPVENPALAKPRLSPDGRYLAFTRAIDVTKRDVWIFDLDRNVPTRLTFDEGSGTPVWSPDGTRLAYQSTRDGSGNLYVRDLKTNTDELIVSSPLSKAPNAWSPDGTTLLFNQSPQAMPEIWGVRMSGDRTPFPLVKTGYAAGFATFSPDGKWFAYCEGDSGPDQVYVQAFPPNGTRLRVSTTSSSAPQWSDDGKQILYTTTEDEVMVVDVAPEGSTLRISAPRLVVRTLATFNHRAVLFDAARSRILIRDLAEMVQPPAIHVVVNWLEEVRAALRVRGEGR